MHGTSNEFGRSSGSIDMTPQPAPSSLRRIAISPIWLCPFLLVGLMAAWPHVLVAQSPEAEGALRVGDLWIYDTKNEVTGLPAQGYTEMIARVLPKEVIVNRTYSTPVITPVEAIFRRPQNSIFT